MKAEVLIALSCLTLCDPKDCIACQALLSMEFSGEEYRTGLLFGSPGDLPNPGIKPVSPALQADSSASESQGKPCFLYVCINTCIQLYTCVPINMYVYMYIYRERDTHVHAYVRRCLCEQTDTCRRLSLIQPHIKRNSGGFFGFAHHSMFSA